MPAKPRKIVSAQGGVAIVNHCAIANLLRIVNLLRHSIFSTAGPLGLSGAGFGGDPALVREFELKISGKK